jgi:hypothetical protein
LLIRVTRVKKGEPVSWRSTRNKPLEFTNHVGTGWSQVFG